MSIPAPLACNVALPPLLVLAEGARLRTQSGAVVTSAEGSRVSVSHSHGSAVSCTTDARRTHLWLSRLPVRYRGYEEDMKIRSGFLLTGGVLAVSWSVWAQTGRGRVVRGLIKAVTAPIR